MITLITGVPGACKTLYCLATIDKKATAEGRPVFYHGINEVKLPWLKLEDPQKWYELPANAIVVIDEAQTQWRPRGTGSAVPMSVAKMETHRHQGIDIVLLTQHPGLVDANIRKLVGQHLHCVRNFGMHKSTIHEWAQVNENCLKSRANSVRHEWWFEKKYFEMYKSAEVHTHRRNIPFRIWFLLATPFIIGICGYLVYKRLPGVGQERPVKTQDKGGKEVEGGKGVSKAVTAAAPTMAARDIVAEYTPRIADLPETAPIYDSLSAPKVFPVVAACVQSKSKGCTCYTQQGTVLAVSDVRCTAFVSRGSFDPYRTAVEPYNGAQPQRLQAPIEEPQPQVFRAPAPSAPVAQPMQSSDAVPVRVPDSSPWRFQPGQRSALSMDMPLAAWRSEATLRPRG